MEADRDAMRLSPLDNVATVLRAVAPGEAVRLGGGEAVPAADAIPLCHKLALRPIRAGEAVVKYGHPIGIATAAIEPGRHVHVHNMRSARAALTQRREETAPCPPI